MSFTLTGPEAMKRKLVGARAGILRDAIKAINIEAEQVMTRSKQEYVPVDEGTLRNTGHVVHAQLINKKITVRMRYGPIVTAIVIHESPDYDPPSWRKFEGPGGVNFRRGGPKFLERPLRAALTGMGERIAKEIRL